ncbi:Nn.00g017720.m01.CDS01 [Neocucurbitaria sp. VM-36]
MAAPSTAPTHEEDVYDDDPRYDDADISTVPFVQQPAYGRGLWKNPINFVSAARELPPQTTGSTNGRTMAEKYLAIMFPNGQPQPKLEAYPLCGICGEPVKETDQRIHYLSPTHQAALPRAPIPSAIDRTRMGLKYMEKHGYDVDARIGLGASGQGMLFPLVPKEKRDKFGLGIDKKEHTKKRALGGASAADVKEGKLDAGKVRKLATVEKKKHERLQRMFYGNDEVEKYLGQLDG